MSRKFTDHRMIETKPTNASYTSESLATRGLSSGWVEITIPHTGDAVGTMSLKGGNQKAPSTHDDLAIDTAQLYINGAALSTTAFTGITHGGVTTPGTLAIAATQVADARIRIPAINFPEYISIVWTRTSGGSASQYIEAYTYLHEAA